MKIAPLFFVGLAFGTGCLLSLQGWISLRVALIIWLVAGAIWLALRRWELPGLAAFYVLVIGAGLAHTLLLATTIAPDDLRRLPEEKTFPTTQWRGQIIEEPAAQMSTRITRRALDRFTFVLRVEAWRPTGGRFFDAKIDASWQPARGNVRCTLIGQGKDLQCGDRLVFATALQPVTPPLSPGELDYRAWEAAQGIYFHATIAISNWQCVETGGGDWWRKLSFAARDWAYGRLQLGLEDDPRMADFLAGMLIGYRQQIPADIEQDFRHTGTLHVFAVSGQNVAEVVLVALVLLKLCGLVRWRWAWIFAPVVLWYCLLTGSPSSAIRATVMALALLLAWRLGRPLNPLGCWSLAFLAMLVWNPPMLLDPGAQLSFTVVLGLIFLAPPVARWLDRPFQPDPFLPATLLTFWQRFEKRAWWWATALVASSFAATVVSEPITVIAFHQLTLISLIANLVVVPIAGLITTIGTLSVTVSLVDPVAAAWLNNTNWLLGRGLIAFVGFLAHEPGAAINVPDLRALSAPSPCFIVAPAQDSAFLLVRTRRGAWLFNTGRENPTRATTTHLLQYYGINRLEGLVIAQMSVPDNGGVEIIARDFQPRHLVVPVLPTLSPLQKTMRQHEAAVKNRIETWQRGQRVELGDGVTVEVLSPAPDGPQSHAEDRALVLLFREGNQALLWAGKISETAQRDLLAANPDLHADVLVMGSDTPPDRAWLQALAVRHWLLIPPRDRQTNAPLFPGDVSDFCTVWPLDQTGAVEVSFPTVRGGEPAKIVLRPWLALPPK